MQKAQLLKGLTILYNELELEKLNIIASFIKKYSFMFTDFENENNNKTININEFDHLVETIVRQFTKDNSIKQTLESEDFLPSMYLSYIVIKKRKTNDTLIKLPSNMTIELILFSLSIKYYNYNISKICQALFSNTSNEYNEMIYQLKKDQRINIYNYYLKCTSNFLEEYDSSMLDNLEFLIEKLTQKDFEYIKSISSQNSKLNTLKRLTYDEFDKLFKQFLVYINAPIEWLDFYEHLKSNNLIKFDYSSNTENGECYFDNDKQIWKINLISDGTIRTFVIFVHEFIHYVSHNKNPNINFSLLELPSIYFENIATEFLKDNSYDKEIINEVLNVRKTNNFNLYESIILQFKDILEYKKYGSFSIEKRIEFYRNQIKSMNDFKINITKILKNNGRHDIPDFLLTIEKRDPVDIANEEIDTKIEALAQSGLLILNGYQYLIGSLLAFNILDTTNRKFGNKTMINITNQLGNHSISSIIQLFGIDLSYKQNSSKDNKYQKKLTPNQIKDKNTFHN